MTIDPSRRRAVIAATAILVVGALAAASFVGLPRVRNALAGADGIHDRGALSPRINVCGRWWRAEAGQRPITGAALRVDDPDPVVVDPGPFAPCPPGPCTSDGSASPCHTVVYVKVGDDAYVAYELLGGP